MIIENFAFYILSAAVVLCAIGAVTVRNLFHCAILLALVFICVAGLFFMLDAPFIAATQILIYVGAVTVLLLFAVMLTKRISDNLIKQTNEQILANSIVAALFLAVLSVTILQTNWALHFMAKSIDSVTLIGRLLLSEYLFPFEVVSVVLLAVLIGAIVIAKKDQ